MNIEMLLAGYQMVKEAAIPPEWIDALLEEGERRYNFYGKHGIEMPTLGKDFEMKLPDKQFLNRTRMKDFSKLLQKIIKRV